MVSTGIHGMFRPNCMRGLRWYVVPESSDCIEEDRCKANEWQLGQCGWLAQVLFLLSTFGTKMAVLLFYRRMVKDSVSRAWLYTLWFFLGVTVCAYIAEFIIYMNICHPLEAYWGFYRIGGFQTPFYCIDGQQLDLSIMILLGMSDTWSVVIPLMMLRHYQLDVTRRQKIALNMIFCLGFL